MAKRAFFASMPLVRTFKRGIRVTTRVAVELLHFPCVLLRNLKQAFVPVDEVTIGEAVSFGCGADSNFHEVPKFNNDSEKTYIYTTTVRRSGSRNDRFSTPIPTPIIHCSGAFVTYSV